eukprot:scaffold21039_cov30-Attheya_sp.AAC.3
MANVAWRSALVRCGLTREAIHAINEEGYADTDDLDLVTKETTHTLVNNLRKSKEIIVPVPNPNHVTARSGSAPDLKAYMIRLRNLSDGDDKDSAKLVAKPSKFSNDTRFPSWQRKLENYLGNKTGKTGTPLSYVIREDDAVPTAAELTLLATAHERAIMSTNLTGPSYESDNGLVWGLLQELREGGPVWSFIAKSSTARNGREAFKALVVHYEGAAHQSCSKQAAYVIIANSTCDGERKHHSFEMFINKLTSAYQDLSDYKEDVAEGKKVRDFLEAIKTPALDAGKAQVIAAETGTGLRFRMMSSAYQFRVTGNSGVHVIRTPSHAK